MATTAVTTEMTNVFLRQLITIRPSMPSETHTHNATTIHRYHGEFHPCATAERTHLHLRRFTYHLITLIPSLVLSHNYYSQRQPHQSMRYRGGRHRHHCHPTNKEGKMFNATSQSSKWLIHDTSQKASAYNNRRPRPLSRRCPPTAVPNLP